jgi:metal iron transporter
MICEGQLTWTVKPWVRRLMTRSISITPSIIIAGAVGQEGLSAALDGSQVALSVILPFVSAPLVYFTCRNRYMTMVASNGDLVRMANHWFTAAIAIIIWTVIVVMNVALLVLLGLGID